MKKKMMKRIVILSMKIGLIRMKISLFKHNLRNKKTTFKPILNKHELFSETVATAEEE